MKKKQPGSEPISLEEERMLLAQIAAGNKRARDRLLMSVTGYVMREANLCKLVPGVSREDLYQAGMVGACRALAKFDPSREYRFGTYAIHWIRAEIWALQGANRTLLSGTALRGRGTDERKKHVHTVPMDDFDEANQHGHPLPPELVTESDAEEKHELAAATEVLQELMTAANLTADERWVLERRWLQPNRTSRSSREAERTLSALGKARGLTRERIRQIEANAFRKIRQAKGE